MQRNQRERIVFVILISGLIFFIQQYTVKSWKIFNDLMETLATTILVVEFISPKDSDNADDENQ